MTSHSSGDLNADRRYHYAQDLLTEGYFPEAADLFRQVLELTPNWAPAWFGLGEAEEKAGVPAAAVAAFQRVLALAPADAQGAGVRLARLGVADGQMAPAYVARLFDDYADRFDDHLLRGLNYSGPQIVMAALETVCSVAGRPFHFGRAADLGCGTGLMAAAIAHHVDAMAGVDLSAAMVVKAAQSGLYRAGELSCGDLLAFLDGQSDASFDLLLAADVLVYLGDLAPVLRSATRALRDGGLFAFTVQSLEGDGYRIGHDLRFHHSEAYLRTTVRGAGLTVLLLAPCITRQDAGKPVHGLVVVLGQMAGGDVV